MIQGHAATQVYSNKPNIFEKVFATFFSVVFHPLFIPVYLVAFMAFVHPSAFSGFSDGAKRQTVLIIALNTLFFPLISVLLLKALGFIDSVFLRTKKDRIIPYMAAGIFFFWSYTVFKEQSQYPLFLPSFLLGIFLASSIGLIANIYFKISLHAIGVGGLLGFVIILMRSNTMHMPWVIGLSILITGVVCTSRLLISDHSSKDIIVGLFAGFISQVIAAFVVL